MAALGSAVFKRALEIATELGTVKWARRARILVQQDDARSEGHVVCLARELANRIPEDLDKCWQDLERTFVEAGMLEMALKLATPMATIRSLGLANYLGKDVARLLFEATDLTVLENKFGSLMSLRSGVRAWNAFARMRSCITRWANFSSCGWDRLGGLWRDFQECRFCVELCWTCDLCSDMGKEQLEFCQ